jgi:hypothetical protein
MPKKPKRRMKGSVRIDAPIRPYLTAALSWLGLGAGLGLVVDSGILSWWVGTNGRHQQAAQRSASSIAGTRAASSTICRCQLLTLILLLTLTRTTPLSSTA